MNNSGNTLDTNLLLSSGRYANNMELMKEYYGEQGYFAEFSGFSGNPNGGYLEENCTIEDVSKFCHITKDNDFLKYCVFVACADYLIYKFIKGEFLIGCPNFKENQEINWIIPHKLYDDYDCSFTELIKNEKARLKHEVQMASIPFELMQQVISFEKENEKYKIPLVIASEQLHDISMIEKKTVYDVLILFSYKPEKVSIKVKYNSLVLGKGFIQLLVSKFKRFFAQMLQNLNVKVSEIEMIDQKEKNRVLSFSSSQNDYIPTEQNVIEIFEKVVEKYPDHDAVIFEDKKITYSELGTQSDSVALYLIDRGLRRGECVVIIAERGINFLVLMLGIIKAGGVYVPVDSSLPVDRINYMIEDCNPKIVITCDCDDPIEIKYEYLKFEEILANMSVGSKPEISISSSDLMYIIYTSGTTGKPKGVMLEHKGIISLNSWFKSYLKISEMDNIAQFASISFDASIWEIMMSILNGSTLYILSRNIINDIEMFAKYVQCKQISVLTLPPQFFLQLRLNTPRLIITAGSASTRAVLEKVPDTCRYINAYGPTENTICSSYWEYKKENGIPKIIPIGRPMPNQRVFIFNGSKLCGIGEPGELCVSGVGVARGYLGKDELTREKFELSQVCDEIIYHTGDIARWDEAGNVLFMGRQDGQVKINGYRIELGEIEYCFGKIEGVKSVAVCIDETLEEKSLFAFYTADKKLNEDNIQSLLEQELPRYMVPKRIYYVDEIPVTHNGKTDTKELLRMAKEVKVLFEELTSDEERALAEAWRLVLNVDKIGRNDSFYELGGDSIKAIRVVAKLHEKDFDISAQTILKEKTIANSAKYLKKVEKKYIEENSEVIGNVEFTPIQNVFYGRNLENKDYYNQAIMIEDREGFDVEILRKVFNYITWYHDALRITVSEDRVQTINAFSEDNFFTLEEFDLRTEEEDVAEHIEKISNRIQASMNLEYGPLVKVALFHLEKTDCLLIAIHHMVVDGISWRILLEDIQALYGKCVLGVELQLPPKTNSYKTWAAKLIEASKLYKFARESDYWDSIEQQAKENQFKALRKENDTLLYKNISFKLTEEDTEKLIYQENNKFSLETNEVLLAALGRAVYMSTNQEKIAVQVEGHGREVIDEEIDISRTVGWFTTIYPVILSGTKDITSGIINVKDAIRRIPNNGIGYGLLRFLNKSDIKLERLDIGFNYLGEIDNETYEDTEVKMAQYSCGASTDRTNRLSNPIMLNCKVSNKVFECDITYESNIFGDSIVEEFLSNYKKAILDVLIECNCCEGEKIMTATDFSSELTTEVFSELENMF